MTTTPLATLIPDAAHWAQGDPHTEGRLTLDDAIVEASPLDSLSHNLSTLVMVLEEMEGCSLKGSPLGIIARPLGIIAQWNDDPDRDWSEVARAISRYDEEIDRLDHPLTTARTLVSHLSAIIDDYTALPLTDPLSTTVAKYLDSVTDHLEELTALHLLTPYLHPEDWNRPPAEQRRIFLETLQEFARDTELPLTRVHNRFAQAAGTPTLDDFLSNPPPWPRLQEIAANYDAIPSPLQQKETTP